MIFLSGGGDETKTVAIDSFFLEKIRGKNILYVPIAKSADMNGYRKSLDWVTAKLHKLSKESLKIVMLLDLATCGDLSEYSAVYLGGGNTYRLLNNANQSGFSDKLKSYITRGGNVYGASAGAVFMGADISTYIEDKYLPENERCGYKDTEGLGLVGKYSILTHFHGGDRVKLDPYFGKRAYPVIAIPVGVAVIVKDNSIIAIGDQDVSIFDKNGTLGKIEPNTAIPLR